MLMMTDEGGDGAPVCVFIAQGTPLETELYNARMFLHRCQNIFVIAKFMQRRWRGGRRGHEDGLWPTVLLYGRLLVAVTLMVAVATGDGGDYEHEVQ
jgi:hypothetical protein